MHEPFFIVGEEGGAYSYGIYFLLPSDVTLIYY